VPLQPEKYSVRCVCTNCGWGQPDGCWLSLEQGVPIKQYLCFQCGCDSLKAVNNAAQRPARERKPSKRASDTSNNVSTPVGPPAAPEAPADIVAALKKMGFATREAENVAARVKAEHPDAPPEELLRIALQEAG